MSLIDQLNFFLTAIRANIGISLWIMAILWGIHFLNILVGYRLNYLGIHPRHPFGLIGIAFAPVLHGGFNHLFFNSIPLFILINLILLGGIPLLICVTVSIAVISGFATWLFGRSAIHVGASALIMGYWGYLLMNAYQNPSLMSIVLGVVCIYYLGGLFFQIFPSEESVSWEGHLFGLLAGVATFYICDHYLGLRLQLGVY